MRRRPAGEAAGAAPAGGGRGGRKGGRGGPQVTPVVAVKATKGNIGVYFTGLGAVTPIYTVAVKTRVDGQLMKVYYKEGDIVHEGAPLAEIDPRPYQVQLTQAEGTLLRDQAILENARVDLKRYQTLLTQNAIPEQQLATQQATVSQEEGIVKSDQGAIDSAKLNIVYCHITAPITGRIGLRLVDPGNIVQATSSNGLLVITQIQPISVIFTISEAQLPAVYAKYRVGQRLEVDAYDPANTQKIGSGRLTTIDNQIDPSTGTVKLRADFNNSDNALFPNQFVNVSLLVQEKTNVTLLQTAAVQRNSNMSYVYLVKPDNTVTVRPIAVGTTQGDESEITSGLNPGDMVVMTGVDKLQEGSKVIPHIDGQTVAPTAARRGTGAGGKKSAPGSGANGSRSQGGNVQGPANGVAGAPQPAGEAQTGTAAGQRNPGSPVRTRGQKQ